MTKGQTIKALREGKGISQTDLANMVGISKQTLYKYETGKVTNIPSDVIEKISYRLDCSPGQIMGWEGDKPFTVSLEQKEMPHGQIMSYAKKLSELSPSKRKNVMKLIDLLHNPEEEDKK